MEEEINYKTIREVQRSEKENVGLTTLGKEFTELVQEYLHELNNRLNKAKAEKTLFSDELVEQLQLELSNARKIITDVFERRERKIVLKALMNTRTMSDIKTSDNFLPEEEKFYKKIKTHIENNRDNFLNTLLTPVKREREQKVLKTLKVRILEEIPSFVWDDEKTYGPYEKEVEAEMPQNIAEFLIDNNKAAKNETTKKSEEILPEMPGSRRAQNSASKEQEEKLTGTG